MKYATRFMLRLKSEIYQRCPFIYYLPFFYQAIVCKGHQLDSWKIGCFQVKKQKYSKTWKWQTDFKRRYPGKNCEVDREEGNQKKK